MPTSLMHWRDSDMPLCWLERPKLGQGANGQSDESSGLIRNSAAVHTLLALLKGRQWPANEGWGAIHRSPPLACSWLSTRSSQRFSIDFRHTTI